MADYIVEHELWQRTTYLEFVSGLYAKQRDSNPPPVSAAQNAIRAKINQGRWIVECPNAGCGGAFCASSRQPYFICVDCGSPENGGQWYHVHFPPRKREIEETLLKRPDKGRGPFNAANRNWVPSETLEELIAENKAKGVL